MGDIFSAPLEYAAETEALEEAKSARGDILAFLRESLGYQKETMQWQKDIYERERGETKPYREASLRALGKLEDVFGEGYDITQDKQYQVLSEAGDRELQKSLAKKGLSLSGYGLEEEARLKSGLKIGVLGQRIAGLGSMAGFGTMGATAQPMLANMGEISQTYGNMAQVPAWYAQQAGQYYRNVASSVKDSEQSMQSVFGSILGGYLGGACWVAEELYGKYSYKTYIIRSYVINHMIDSSILGSFCRLYSKHGTKWASWVRNSKAVRVISKVIWDYLYKKALKEEQNHELLTCWI